MEKKIFKGFYHIWAWQPFWLMGHAHFSNLSFSCPRRLRMKFEQHWPGGFRGKAIWNYQHFFHTNVWGPYKCIQKQTWPRRKKVKCQCMTIILAWRPSWSTNCDHFSNLSFPLPEKAPYEIWAKLVQRLQRRSCLKCWTFIPYKCIRKQNWPYRKKGQMSMYDHYFSNFGSPPVPDDICKDSVIRHARFWRRRFLKGFFHTNA